MSDRVEVVLATSRGGHVEELRSVESAWTDRVHDWVMPDGRQSEALQAEGARVEHVVNPRRYPLQVVRNAAQALYAWWRLRPRVVVSGGSNTALAFCMIARLLGSRVFFFETVPRVHELSLTGRIMYRVANRFLVQWPELTERYPRAEVCRPALFERTGRARENRAGTFVAVGTHNQPFTRLLELVDAAEASGALPSPVTRQIEPTMPAEEFRENVANSEVVITHGGAGTVSLALAHGARPLVLPRREELGEHVDNHQVEMCEKLEELGLIVSLERHPVEEARELARRRPAPLEAPGPRLDARLRELIDQALR